MGSNKELRKRSLIEDHLRNAPTETECAANRVEKGLGERLGEVCLEQSDDRPCVVLQKRSTIRLDGAKRNRTGTKLGRPTSSCDVDTPPERSYTTDNFAAGEPIPPRA